MSAILFEDIFQVNDVNPDGKKFERGRQCTPPQSWWCLAHAVVLFVPAVTRLMATGESYEMEMLLDVNCEVYPVRCARILSFATAFSDFQPVTRWTAMADTAVRLPAR